MTLLVAVRGRDSTTTTSLILKSGFNWLASCDCNSWRKARASATARSGTM